MQFLISKKTFDKLPKHLQEILVVSMRVAAYDMYSQNYDMNANAWAKMSSEYPNIQVKTFPKEIMNAMKKANAELRTELSAKSPELKEVLDHQEAYMKKAREWTRMSDFLYLKDNLK